MALRLLPLVCLLYALMGGALFAGSNDAVISGKTESGRTVFKLLVGDITGSIRSAELTIDGKSYLVKEGEIRHQTVIRDEKNGIYVLIFETDEQLFRLWMIPHSEKVSQDTDGSYHSTFGAVLEATDPRESGKHALSPRITIGCSLRYEI